MLKTKLLFIPFFIGVTLNAQNVRFNLAAGCSPVVQSFGGIDVTLTPSATPQNVANFMTYVNSGAYNCTIIHRSLNAGNSASTPPYIIQGGGYALGAANLPTLIPQNPPVVNEFSASNQGGTLAMALYGSDINSATNEWFFNVTNNGSAFDGGKYTVFGNIANDASTAVLANVNQITTFAYNAGTEANFANLPLYNYSCPNTTCPLIRPANYVFVTSIKTIGQPTFTAPGVTDAATYINSNKAGISPGEIITVFGSNFGSTNPSYMGPTLATTLQLDSAGNVKSNLEGTQVTFNGLPGTMDFTSDQQLAVIVPYEIANASTVDLVVSYLGGSSTKATFNVVPTTPGLFTLNQSGQGDAAIVRINNDGSASIISASNPANVGDFLELYGEGYGVATSNTKLPDGAVVGTILPQPAAQTTLLIDNKPVTTQYFGGAGGDVNGVLQVNFVVPQLAPGSHQIQIQAGNAISPTGVTLQTR